MTVATVATAPPQPTVRKTLRLDFFSTSPVAVAFFLSFFFFGAGRERESLVEVFGLGRVGGRGCVLREGGFFFLCLEVC